MTLTAASRRFPAPPRHGSTAAQDGSAQTRRGRRQLSQAATERGPVPMDAPTRPPRVVRRLRGSGVRLWLRRLRVPLALLSGGCAVLAVLLAGAEAQGETTAVVRVTQDVAAGQELTPAMLEEVSVDAEAVPAQQVSGTGQPGVEELLGRQAAVPLPRGAVVLSSQLVGPALLVGQPEGHVAVPVRPADTALVGMLTPGQQVDVILSAESVEEGASSRTVAQAAPVLWTPSGESDDWFPQAGESGQVVVIAVEPSTAQEIAQAAHQGRLHLSLVG